MLEHFYNPANWFAQALQINSYFLIEFSANTNSENLFILKRLIKLQHMAEFVEKQKLKKKRTRFDSGIYQIA